MTVLEVGAHQHRCPRRATRFQHRRGCRGCVDRAVGGQHSPLWGGKGGRGGVWASWERVRAPKGRAGCPEPARLQAVRPIPGCPVWGHSPCQRGWAVPDASCHSCRSSDTIAASPVSSLPLLLPVFLGAERWEAPSWRAGSQPLSPSFCLSPTHSSPLQQPAQGQGGQVGSRPGRWRERGAPLGSLGATALFGGARSGPRARLRALLFMDSALTGEPVRGAERASHLSSLEARWPLVLPPPPALVSVFSRASCTRAVPRGSKRSWAGGLGSPPSSRQIYIGAI